MTFMRPSPAMRSWEALPSLRLGPSQVVVGLEATGLHPWTAPFAEPFETGRRPDSVVEVAGVVRAVGEAVHNLRIGQAVFGTSGWDIRRGASHAICEAESLAPRPVEITAIEAAALPLAAVAAHQLLGALRFSAGRSVLIHGATGRVGRFFQQLARRAGLCVSATARPGDLPALRRMGVAPTVDLQHPDGPLVDAVVDLVGGEDQGGLLRFLPAGGQLVSTVRTPDILEARERGVRAWAFRIEAGRSALAAVAELAAEGCLQIEIAAILPLYAASDEGARRAMAASKGTVVVAVG